MFEALVALVILGLSAVGFLDAFQGSSRATRDAHAWAHAVSYAEAAMEETKLGVTVLPSESLPGGFQRNVAIRIWSDSPAVQEITVSIAFPDGRTLVLRRLVRT